MKIILASQSPRRQELLKQIGISFEVIVSDCEEVTSSLKPSEMVEELSRLKASEVMGKVKEEMTEVLVIGADTIVAIDDKVLGKPKDAEEAKEMLRLLAGHTHFVYTGVTLYYSVNGSSRIITFHEKTKVEFYHMTEKELEEYVASKEPMDKAGAYGIQGMGAKYIKGIAGDYNNVVGLPIGRVHQEMKRGDLYFRKKKAVIFDLDGTLSDSLASIKYCGDKAMEYFGYGPFSSKQYQYFVGDGAANLVRRCLAEGGDTEGIHFDKAFDLYKSIFREHCMYEVRPYDGILELLQALKQRNIKIAVLSNKPHEETIKVVETLFGKGYFDIIQGQKPEVAIKPSPEGVFRILEEWNLSVEETLYLGDTSTDMQTGKSAGACTIGALWGFRERIELEENNADFIIENPIQLLDYIA